MNNALIFVLCAVALGCSETPAPVVQQSVAPSLVRVDVEGEFTGTLIPEVGKADGNGLVWLRTAIIGPFPDCTVRLHTNRVDAVSAPGCYVAAVGGYTHFRMRTSAWTGGAVRIRAVPIEPPFHISEGVVRSSGEAVVMELSR